MTIFFHIHITPMIVRVRLVRTGSCFLYVERLTWYISIYIKLKDLIDYAILQIRDIILVSGRRMCDGRMNVFYQFGP